MKKLLLIGASAFVLSACQNAFPAQSATAPLHISAVPADREVLPVDAIPVAYDIAIRPYIDEKRFDGEAKAHRQCPQQHRQDRRERH